MYDPPCTRLRLAICDDDAPCLNQIAQWTQEILHSEAIAADIDRFQSAAELLNAVEAGAAYAVLLLDVVMDGMDGMTLASALRAQGDKAAIIFVSSNREMALKGYEVAAARYLAKPLEREKLREALLYCCRLAQPEREILLPTAEGHSRIHPSSVMYAETYGRGVRLALCDGQLETRLKISELAAMLPAAQYVLCHRAFLVNLDFVSSIRYCELELKNGARLPISKYRLSETRARLLRYLER